MAYLKGGTVVDGDLTVEGELKVSSVIKNSTLKGIGDEESILTDNTDTGVPDGEVKYWEFK